MEQRAEQLKALADPLRLRLMGLLHDRGETCVCELVDALGTTQGNISTHLRVLRAAGLIRSQKLGKWVFYRLEHEAVGELLGWLGAQVGPESACCRPPAGALYPVCCAGGAPLSRSQAAALVGGSGCGEVCDG